MACCHDGKSCLSCDKALAAERGRVLRETVAQIRMAWGHAKWCRCLIHDEETCGRGEVFYCREVHQDPRCVAWRTNLIALLISPPAPSLSQEQIDKALKQGQVGVADLEAQLDEVFPPAHRTRRER